MATKSDGIRFGTKFETSLLVNAAKLYYVDGLKQEEIAKRLGISRSLISMILSEARECGIVEIHVHDPFVSNEGLAADIRERFRLNGCIVVPAAVKDDEGLRSILAQRAVGFLDGLLKNQSVLGLGWGRTCYQIMNALPAAPDPREIIVVPLIGGTSQRAPYFQLNEIVRVFAEKVGGSPHFIHAPCLVTGADERRMYWSSSSMRSIREKWRAMDVVVTGIGTLPNKRETSRAVFKGEGEIYRRLEGSGAVGDLCAHYFTQDGNFVENDYTEQVLNVPVDDLKKTGNVVCVSGGPDKPGAVLGALRTGVVGVLICDEATAREVLRLDRTA